MSKPLLLKNVRPLGQEPADILVVNGVIKTVASHIEPTDNVAVFDGKNQLLLPGLVNAHAHIDKNLLGQKWHKNQVPNNTIQELTRYERQMQRELGLSVRTQSALEVEASIIAGTTHIRTHIDIDPEIGLTGFEAVMETQDAYKEAMTMQTVAFPQRGMLVLPGTVTLLEEALKLGADCIGGLDPSTIDRDPVKHVDTVFELAERHAVEVDIHLHEPGLLGAFAVELIAERTRVLGMQGRVTISHVFCLGMIAEAYLDKLIDLIVENQLTIMSLGSGSHAFPPLKRLHEAGVRLCTGTDGIRDTWGPYGHFDMLERVKLFGLSQRLSQR